MHGTNPLAVQLANLLSELAPRYATENGQTSGWTVKFQCGGSEVTESAIKLARQYHRLTGNHGRLESIFETSLTLHIAFEVFGVSTVPVVERIRLLQIRHTKAVPNSHARTKIPPANPT